MSDTFDTRFGGIRRLYGVEEAEKLRHFLQNDLRNAVAGLAAAARTLNAYAEVTPRASSASVRPPANANATDTAGDEKERS